VLADASDARVQQVEGNVYFPLDAVRQDFLRPSETQTVCPWKAQPAIYYDVVVDGQVNRDAAWYYPTPKDAVKHIAGHVAFCMAFASKAEPS